MLASSNSSIQSLQRAKLQQHRRFAPASSEPKPDLWSLGIVVVAHLAVLLYFFLTPQPSAKPAASKPRVIQVALTPQSPPSSAVPPSANSKASQIASLTNAATSTISAPPEAAPLPSNSPPDEVQNETPLVRSAEEHYFTRTQLTEKPSVIQDIDNDIELNIPSAQAQDLRLLLFINEEGGVDKLEILQADVQVEVSNILLAKFSRLKFTPGKIDGVAVKSQLGIEVHLEANVTPPLVTGGAKSR
jgi:hypothetical protein